MPDEARLVAAFVLGLGVALAFTPVAIAVATRTGFLDRPVGWKSHHAPTPYLGGAVVLVAFALAAMMAGQDPARLTPIVVGAGGMWLVGTIDDRRPLPVSLRLGLEALIAAGLWIFDLGWEVFEVPALNLFLTIVWVLAVVNALNVFDIMDGAAATVAAISALSLAAIALLEGDVALAVVVVGLAGACLGFLPYNLAGPARIFLGDGGSMPIGFVLAASASALSHEHALGWELALVAVLVVGLPLIDTALRVVTRRRAGISPLTAGRDGVAHRLLPRLTSARNVAVVLGLLQAGLGAIAIGAVQLGEGAIVAAWTTWFLVAVGAVALLETEAWSPERTEVTRAPGNVSARRGAPRPSPSLVEVCIASFIALSLGLSPFLYGFYDVSVWGPIALGMLAALLGLLIARPAAPTRLALVGAGALVALWLWALISTGWSESADQALTEANRWLLYAALFGVLVLLVKDDRLGTVIVGASAATVLALGGYLAIRMLSGGGSELFLYGRLNDPLGYINGQSGYLLLGVWPLIALAERARGPLVAGAGLAGATFLAGLVLLGQTRAVIPAVAVSALLLLVAVPGRTRRGWALVVAGAGVAACIGPVVDVYDSAGGARPPTESVIRDAAFAIVLASLAAGAVWAGAVAAVGRLGKRAAAARRLAWVPLVLGVLVAAAVGFASLNDPAGRVRSEYNAFVELEVRTEASSRFTTGGGNRYDYWRVAFNQFEDEPLRGVGAGNYDRTYFIDRETFEDIRQPHSIELQTLGELGVVGGALLAVFLVAILAGFARRARAAREAPRSRFLAVAAGGIFLVWLVHTSVDWLHLIPGVTGIALCAAAVLVGPWARPRASGGGAKRPLIVVACAALALVGAVLVGRAALAERYLDEGRAVLDSEPPVALERANESLQINDEALAAYYLRSAAWARLGNYRQARAALIEATRREPHDFLPWTLLGDLATRRGDTRQAARDYGRARRLNPRDPTIAALARDSRRRQ